MTNTVAEYIKCWYDTIYDSVSKTITHEYFDVISNHNTPIINPDKFIFDIITKFIIIRNENKSEYFMNMEDYKIYRQTLYDYVIDKTNMMNIYEYKYDEYRTDGIHKWYSCYLSNMYYHDRLIVPDDKIKDALDHILTIP